MIKKSLIVQQEYPYNRAGWLDLFPEYLPSERHDADGYLNTCRCNSKVKYRLILRETTVIETILDPYEKD